MVYFFLKHVQKCVERVRTHVRDAYNNRHISIRFGSTKFTDA